MTSRRAADRHDQPPPAPNASRPIIELVLADIADPLVAADLRERAEVGRARYGVYLQAHNGRDALLDAYQEAQDQVMYLRQAAAEETNALDRLVLLELYAYAAGLLVRVRHAMTCRRISRYLRQSGTLAPGQDIDMDRAPYAGPVATLSPLDRREHRRYEAMARASDRRAVRRSDR